MKKFFLLMTVFLFIFACNKEGEHSQEDSDANHAAQETFEKNCKTVLANLEGWQNENLDYSQYAENFYMSDTGFGADPDSLSLNEVIAGDKQFWASYDFKMLNEPALLPGVNAETGKLDGSVRHYSEWELTKSATDSTPAKSGKINLYETFDFDENGKIVSQAVYGDFTGIMTYLNSDQ